MPLLNLGIGFGYEPETVKQSYLTSLIVVFIVTSIAYLILNSSTKKTKSIIEPII